MLQLHLLLLHFKLQQDELQQVRHHAIALTTHAQVLARVVKLSQPPTSTIRGGRTEDNHQLAKHRALLKAPFAVHASKKQTNNKVPLAVMIRMLKEL